MTQIVFIIGNASSGIGKTNRLLEEQLREEVEYKLSQMPTIKEQVIRDNFQQYENRAIAIAHKRKKK